MFFRPMTNRRNEGRTVEPNCSLNGEFLPEPRGYRDLMPGTEQQVGEPTRC
ncbi:hypothetical protein ABIA24_005744 [Sinorhizobium fredii]